MSKWTRWRPIDAPSGCLGAAAYQVRLKRRSRPVSLARLLGRDTSGVLAIGEAGNLEKRRKQFLRGLRTGAGHSEADLIWLLTLTGRAERLFTGTALEYRFRSAPNKQAATDFEKKAFWSYVRRFGEVPPFNSSFPGRRALIEGHRRKTSRGAS